MATRLNIDKQVIPIGQVKASVDRFVRKGYTIEEILDGTDLTLASLGNDSHKVSYRQRIRQLENMIRLSDESGFWLKEEEPDATISAYGLLGYAMMSSATLHKAVGVAAKYHKMAGAMFDLEYLQDQQDAVLRIHHLLVRDEVGQMVVEELFRGITPLISLLLGHEHRPKEIRLSYRAPTYVELYDKAFNCPVKFDQLFCEYRFSAALLDEPLADADADTARICEESCQALLRELDIDDDLVSRICQVLLSVPGAFPCLDEIADKLHLGPRTLRRRLKELDTSYQKILDDVRRELAIQYLTTTDLSTQQVSDLLGYTEVTNFRRAFVKWVGNSPFRFRKLQKVTRSREPGPI
jgi:AraC-like DNA-binding protein